jgi:alpha-1,3-mannosyltransferase
MGEPMTLAKDFWRAGLGKILAVPSVNVGYEYDGAQDAKEKRGYVHQIVGHIQYNSQDELVSWQESPPSMVKCMPVFSRQWWVPPT